MALFSRTPHSETVFEQAAQNKTGEQFFVEAVIGHHRKAKKGTQYLPDPLEGV